MQTKKSGEDLATEYTDPEWRKRYLRLVDAVTLLRHCIIPASYKIPDRMNAAIHLTDYGTRIQQTLTTKHDVPAKEARLMCLLEMAHEEPMVDLQGTRLDEIVDEISSQVLKGTIRYPFIFGGTLYRRAAGLFPDRRAQLNSEETRELLEATPRGVFQVTDLVVGPLGVRHAKQGRWLPPTLDIPLQHCDDLTCRRVHLTSLSTDFDCAINQHLPKMAKVLDPAVVARGAWTEFTGIITETESVAYDDMQMMGVPIAVGECLTDHELRKLAEAICIDVADSADRAELLQLIWLESDIDIVRATDSLIRAGDIEIDAAEIRRPQLVDVEIGSFGLRTEFGCHGVRLKPRSTDIPHLRLRRLVGGLYDKEDERDRTELLWQLRSVDGIGLEGRLEEYLRTAPPGEVIRSLVLARRSNVERALLGLRADLGCVGLGEVSPAEDDTVIVEKLMWKLGFDRELRQSQASDFWNAHAVMKQAVRDAQASAVVDVQRLRNAGRDMFISLEGLLDDTLGFAWWVLSTDHLAAGRPFTYSGSMGEPAWTAIAAYLATENSQSKLRIGDVKTLYPLGQAFGVLARLLTAFTADRSRYERASDSIPRWARESELREFCFHHTIPYLDLAPVSQAHLQSGLTQVSAILKDANVHGIRNSMSHFQRSSSSIDEVEKAVAGSNNAVELLESLGLVRVEYRRAGVTVDQWNRSLVVMRSAGGDEITFQRPSRVGMVGLPSPDTPQHLVRGAVFSSPNEVLRFRVGVDSPFSEMWSDFPLPRASRRGRRLVLPGQATDVARGSHGVLPQT